MSQRLSKTLKNARCTFSVVETELEFDALEKLWNELIDKSDVSVFQTFEWQRTWWKYFREGRRLHIVVFKLEGCLAGIAPMFLKDINLAGIRVATQLQFIGAEVSDYLQFIIAPGCEEAVLHAFVHFLRSPNVRWDIFDIRDVSERFALLRTLPQILTRSGFPVYTSVKTECPQVALPQTWEEFVDDLSSNMRHNLKRKKQRLENKFTSELEVFKNQHDDIQMAIDELAKLHTRRWNSLGYPSAFDRPDWVRFHFDVAQKLVQRGWLRIFFLKVNGMRVATSLDFNFHNRIYVYLSHADGPEEIMKLSPGYLLRCSAVRQGIAEGMQTYDFLRGNEKYKYQEFPSEKKENWSIRAISPSLSGRIRYNIFVIGEFFIRLQKRIRREYFDLKRYCIEHKPSSFEVLKYTTARLWGVLLFSLSIAFRDSPPH